MEITDNVVDEFVAKCGGDDHDKPAEPIRMTPVGVGRALEKCGFLRSVAGDADFDRTVRAIMLATQEERGIIFTGRNGVGKTRAMEAVWRRIFTVYKEWIDCTNVEDLANLRSVDLLDQSVFIDDYGAESMLYGRVDAVGEFISSWYSRHGRGKRLYLTTNLSSDEINRRSGGRVLDRIRELCVICAFEGTSKRKTVIA